MPIPRCQALPVADSQVSFLIDGQERLRWHAGTNAPRPYFYPLIGASGISLTRMGHPGAPDHDHHASIWFAHHKVVGIDFWGNRSPAHIRQLEWLCYEDGDTQAAMAVRLGWFDGHDPKELLVQELIAIMRPGPDGETFLEVQSRFIPTAMQLEFGQTNFGFFAVRVAKHISALFGGGTLTGSTRAEGEPALFAKPAKWMDYSGAVSNEIHEGISYFDHPDNPGFPSHWHVREDGWMCASPCLSGPLMTTRDAPLTLRYLLHAHRGALDVARAELLAADFAATSGLDLKPAQVKHTRHQIVRRM